MENERLKEELNVSAMDELNAGSYESSTSSSMSSSSSSSTTTIIIIEEDIIE